MRLSLPGPSSLLRLGFGALLAAALLHALAPTLAYAGSPLGIGTAEPSFAMTGPFAGVMLFVNEHQQAFYRALTGALRDMRQDTHALWLLIGLSFAYGVFHAAGPGHGKAVISSYMIANEIQLRRGIAIAFVSSMVQGLVAIFAVGLIFLTLRGTGFTLTRATDTMEAASFALVVLFGCWLFLRKTRTLIRARPQKAALPLSGTTAPLFAGAGTGTSAATGLLFQAQALDHTHIGPEDGTYCEDCRGAHMPEPALLGAERFHLREAWSAIMAVGLRPCSGALLVMTFSMLNRLYLGGILSVAAMALGTAVTVSALALAAVGAKGLALRLSGPGSATARRVGTIIELGGALFVILLGMVLLMASLAGDHISSL
ncbi:nickel/cobalt transporter [Allorhizobium sp. BGMRC 0089]|uniref:nickel/cobalt transporter n=1 Tax=Allorhizobium sonneratiae TaxID=2934936 RepID=UPI0020341660|nr:nickel/cobalt transporter [Allorhizobium sonneratiae]MCM2290808.1 nickel/cobalt transporter [Allorhizobium sonneratiae]